MYHKKSTAARNAHPSEVSTRTTPPKVVCIAAHLPVASTKDTPQNVIYEQSAPINFEAFTDNATKKVLCNTTYPSEAPVCKGYTEKKNVFRENETPI